MKTQYFLFFSLVLLLANFGVEKNLRSESLLYGIDTNSNGKIEMEEWQGNQRTFEEYDLNHDKVLSGSELTPDMIRSVSQVTPAGQVIRIETKTQVKEGQ